MRAYLLLALAVAGCMAWPAVAPERTAWAFTDTQLDALHDRGLDGHGVTVGIVDTGIDASHPDLAGAHITAWADLAGGASDPYDTDGHGTHVAALVAGTGPLRGGAPGVNLVVVKVFDSHRNATDQAVAQGIQFAVDHGARIIGLSLGGASLPILGTATENAAKSAVNAGVLVVAAAGNSGPNDNDVVAPADVQGVIAVAAIDSHHQVASFSNRGNPDSVSLVAQVGVPRQAPDEKPEVSAPGVEVTSAYLGHGYATMSGTSTSVPFVVSALALLLQAHPGDAPSDASGVERVKGWLASSAEPVPGGAIPHDAASGYGLLQAARLVDAG
ncbi:MAG: S8 family serine peptidase [Thermoplasmatota archaeon]